MTKQNYDIEEIQLRDIAHCLSPFDIVNLDVKVEGVKIKRKGIVTSITTEGFVTISLDQSKIKLQEMRDGRI